MLVAAACAGSRNERTVEPRIPARTAERLADRSNRIADELAAGSVCSAAHEADALKDDVDSAIAAGEVPRRLRPQLVATALDLRNRVNCPTPPEPPPSAPAPPPAEKPKPKKHEHKEHPEKKGHGESVATPQPPPSAPPAQPPPSPPPPGVSVPVPIPSVP